MPTCELSPEDKKKYVSDVGRELVKEHGKQKHYKPEQVKKASRRAGYDIDYICWAYCFYLDEAAFVAIHDAMGEVCDYIAMRKEVLTEMAPDISFLGIDLDISWLELPDIELPNIFDWFDFS